MSVWDRFRKKTETSPEQPVKYAIVDAEVGVKDHRVHDIGALRFDGAYFHKSSKSEFLFFIKGIDYICGHNIVHHDAKYLLEGEQRKWKLVDTLYVSPLLFPERPYHKLVKDDKLVSEQMNNPLNDCEKARDLLWDEIARWTSLPLEKKQVFASLLIGQKEFEGFLCMVGAPSLDKRSLPTIIRRIYDGLICSHADIESLVDHWPCALAYALALIETSDYRSNTPAWVIRNFPEIEYVMKLLRHTRCAQGCSYCDSQLDVHLKLKQFFGYDQFRTFEGENLQERAAQAAVDGKSLLAIFPTGGGKSLTFQLPALMQGRTVRGLTVVISPLQSLMKDQVDNLAAKGITDAVTINGLLDPISRALAIERVASGDASLLYIAPEMLRSRTIERILLSRNVVRFVIDEAHCFSSWGQDFRVDYLYIGKFISEYQKRKGNGEKIPVSCFTATAKQKVIQDISDYFERMLGIHLELYATSASRTNLHYSVVHVDSNEDKYLKLRQLISESEGPVIVYVARTKRTHELAERLTRDGMRALPFNGKMDSDDKLANQDAFMNDEVRIIVATSAFGMGVDKKDVELVIHYDISDSLENYVQEAGRAGRDPSLEARCYVLYSDADLDKHFILLNQTKVSISEIQQVWQAIKYLTRYRHRAECSALEIARQAGWDDSVPEIETRVKTTLSALEQAGYIERGNNIPHVYATGITVSNLDEARTRIENSVLFEKKEIEKAVRIIKSLISQKFISRAQDEEAESRVDYLADILGLTKTEVVSAVERMRQEGILADSKDMSAYLQDPGRTQKKSNTSFERFAKLERYILERIPDDSLNISYKQLNDDAVRDGIASATEKDIKTLLYFLTVKGYTRRDDFNLNSVRVARQTDLGSILKRFERRTQICRFAIDWLYAQADLEDESRAVHFSILELLKEFNTHEAMLLDGGVTASISDVEEALLYLSRIGALKLEGGFLVLYNAMDIRRIKDNKFRYRVDDYAMLNEFYRQKIQQIHIVGEYANLMVKDYGAALQYVQDYFQMDYKGFVTKYFKGERAKEIQRNISPEKYQQIFGLLSERQMEIISDKESRCIVVAAGPGSGKTRVLVHKLASLLLLEDVKHEQLLMLTFSRAAATEFKERLMDIIGNAAHFVEIKTFHSFCFDLMGRIGNLEESEDVVQRAAEMIRCGEVEPNRISKTVLVIDEAQDMSSDEFALVQALMAQNEEMRVIAVGDDDQNIFEFRGSDSKYLYELSRLQGSRFLEMTENYRSSKEVVEYANFFSRKIRGRLKRTPIVSKAKEKGIVSITRFSSEYMFEPLVRDLLTRPHIGTIGLLTQTNDEAVILLALLRSRGVNAKLIQSVDGFNFSALAEVRYFLRMLDLTVSTPIIPDEAWHTAKERTFSKYASSTSIVYLARCLELFDRTVRTKYYTDFREFVYESSIEDFSDIDGADVTISTIHKSKGREYDEVYMLIGGGFSLKDEQYRRYYVGLTRAKKNLYIYTGSACFDGGPSFVQYRFDGTEYPLPDEVVLQLTHKDVVLSYFTSRKSAVLALKGGDELELSDVYLLTPKTQKPLAKLSSKMQETLSEWIYKGYHVDAASVRFVVAWKAKDAPKEQAETAVLLPELHLRRV